MATPSGVQGHCPFCGPNRYADVVCEHDSDWEDNGVSGQTTHRLLKCRGCGTVYLRLDEVYSEDIPEVDSRTGEQSLPIKTTYWPAPARRATPGWLVELLLEDNDLYSLLGDVYTALDNDLRVLAAIGIRTVFDRASELLGIDPNRTFAQKLEDLLAAGKVGAGEKEILKVLTDAGSAAAHRGWKPRLEELDAMMGIIESFLHRNFVLPHQARRLREAVPRRGERR